MEGRLRVNANACSRFIERGALRQAAVQRPSYGSATSELRRSRERAAVQLRCELRRNYKRATAQLQAAAQPLFLVIEEALWPGRGMNVKQIFKGTLTIMLRMRRCRKSNI